MCVCVYAGEGGAGSTTGVVDIVDVALRSKPGVPLVANGGVPTHLATLEVRCVSLSMHNAARHAHAGWACSWRLACMCGCARAPTTHSQAHLFLGVRPCAFAGNAVHACV